MNSLTVTALAIVLLIAVSTFRSSSEREGRKFPWFWVAFSITVYSAAALVEMLMVVATTSGVGWTMYMPLADQPGMDFLSNEQFPHRYSDIPLIGYWWLLPLAGLILGAGCSAWAWRHKRV